MSRFHPSRLGLTSIAEYVDETFAFAGGRLVLQGHNGAGKSKALELSIPLLFSGETRPRNLDTFGGSSKKLKDVVLWSESPKESFLQRTGWVWLEFELPAAEDAPARHVTIGAGMHAHREWTDVKTRFFLLDGPRIGHEVELMSGARDVVTFPQLKEALGDPPAARIVESASEFRRLQDEVLFGFGDEDRYGVMVRLLLALRRPNLSENMQPETVGELLTQTLPPIDTALVGRIGGLLEELERIRDDQRETERAADAVRGVHADYLLFAAAVARERAAALRSALDAERAARRRLDATRAAQEKLLAKLEHTRAQRASADRSADAARARIAELRASPEARSARALEEQSAGARRAREAASDLAVAAAGLGESAAETGQHAAAATHDADAALMTATAAADDAAREAQAAGIEGHAAAAARALEPDGPDQARLAGALRALGGDRAQRLRAQRALDARADKARAERDQRAEQRDDAHVLVAGVAERRAELDAHAALAADAHVGAVDAWAATAARILTGADERDELARLAAADGSGEAPARALAAQLAAAASAELARLAGIASERAATLQARADEVRSQRDALAAAPAPDVPAPAWRSGRPRAGADGAPLWQLVDFRADFDDERQRAGLEGALEASGLLDAFVDASGAAWREGELLLTPAPLAGVATIADVLRPDPDCAPDQADRALALLRSIALSHEPLGTGAPAVAPDGRFSFGPARGCHRQPVPRLIGAAARERHRGEQLRALEAELTAHEHAAGEARAEQARLEHEQEQLQLELARYPDPAELRQATRNAQRAADRERDARARLDAAQERLAAADAAVAAARDETVAHRSRHALPADLDALEEALREYASAAQALAGAAVAVRAALQRREAAERRAASARAAAETASRSAADAARQTDALEEALAEARAVAGEGVEQVLARIAELESKETGARARLSTAEEEIEALVERKGAGDAAIVAAEIDADATAAAIAEREAAVRALGAADFLRLALAGAAPDDVTDWRGWTGERCHAIAASVLEHAPKPDEPRHQLATRVDAGYVRLRETLNTHPRLRPFSERTEDDLPVLGARVDGQSRSFVELAAWMDAEVARLRSLLDERQARLLSEHLADDVAEHLHERIFKAREWVERAARTTERCRTSSGMGVLLRLREREDEHPGLRRAVALLKKSPSLLSEAERDELVGFLFERIDSARAADGEESLERLLAHALDYRHWFGFELQVRMPDGSLRPFTRRRKDLGSGGEREILLHLPLLAAAAAVYDAAAGHCPRLIALDEAFNKVDETGERGLLDVIVGLDLDFLLCGYDLWCAHPEVPAVEIYHLKRWDDSFGIVPLHRFRWNGTKTVALDPATGEAA